MSVASTRLRERRMIALRQANQVGGLRAKLKQDLRKGTVRLEQILATGTDYLDGAEVFDLLVAVPKIGPVKAAHLLTIARISPAKTVAALSERQRARLIELLSRERSDGRARRANAGQVVRRSLMYQSGSILSAAVRTQVA